MIVASGQEIKAKRIQRNTLAKAWKTLSSKPMPKIKAWQLTDEDFDAVIKQRRCLEDNLREIEEWGRLLSARGTDACVYNGTKSQGADYIILIRQKPFHRIEEIILHELSHIARGDL